MDASLVKGLFGSDTNFAAVQALHPTGEPKASLIWALTPKTRQGEATTYRIHLEMESDGSVTLRGTFEGPAPSCSKGRIFSTKIFDPSRAWPFIRRV